ncbi:MAG: HAMP domain-containing sensor histidine kinase [Oscillospiraceae bacterium]|nr:HAMP domain-containing histidine kinase [Oscillospiraceae bacterium]MDY4190607.1 HAMP domain-containing sensor histidine kinase [Oscillospiraceae bacterium]
MQKNLFTKWFSICASIILASILVLGVILLAFASRYFKMDKLKVLSRYAGQAATLTTLDYQQYDYQYVNQNTIYTGFSILGDAIEATIFLTDSTGKTLVCTENEAACPHLQYLVPSDILAQAKKGEYRETGKLGGIYKNTMYTVGVPVTVPGGQTAGYVFVSSSAEALTFFLIEILNMFAISSLTIIVIAFIVIYFVTAKMVKPLRDMLKATKSFSDGDFSIRVPIQSYDEIGQLAIAFNNMAGSLASLESVRRSFVANVSHELKTPMTTIAGFIDGILDGTIPPEKQDYYLRIVSEEVKRLARLVRSMLNIAKIEAGEMSINLSDFDINEVVCRVIFSFEQKIEAKHLEVRGLDVEKTMVTADPDLMHQVVYNLMDNAVKFVNEGGYIEILYAKEGGMIFTTVRNSGQGISKEDLPKVFERFYKTDKSRSIDKNGVGLGLHIVRSIVKLHGGDIFVRSEEGQYCEFVFSLPAASSAPHAKRKTE